MKCLILVGRSAFIDETRNSTPLALYVPTIARMQNRSANNMYTVCNFCPCCHDSWCKSCWWWQGGKTSVVFFGIDRGAEQGAIYDLIFSIIFRHNVVIFCLVSEERYELCLESVPVTAWVSDATLAFHPGDWYHSLPYRKSSLITEIKERFPKIKTTYRLQLSLAKTQRIY